MSRPRTDRIRADGLRFGSQAELYDAARPGYPEQVLEICLRSNPVAVLDLGAGTGKLGGALQKRGVGVTAVDPDPQLLARNPCPAVVGTAERIPRDDASADAVVVAQAWHWFDAASACREIRRVLRPDGTLTIVINQLDVRVDWVMRIARIIHAGDVYRPAWRPLLGDGFSLPEAHIVPFTQTVSPSDIESIAATRSYWLRSDDSVRTRVLENIRHFLGVEHPMGERFELPYLSLCYSASRL